MKQRVVTGLCVVAAGIMSAAPASAQSAAEAKASAGALRELDIMLMVTALRCRFGDSDFMADYSRFATRHRSTLGKANSLLLADLARTHGNKGATGALDRMSIGIANRYGNGHPWLDCPALRSATRDLADAAHETELATQASYLLGSGPMGDVQLAARR